MVNVKILGISTSSRHANTEVAVKWALESAAELPGVETAFISLAGKTIYPCDNCASPKGHMCTGAKPSNLCPHITNDDFREVCLKMIEPDGFIIGVMVDYQQAGAQWHNLKSRLVCLEHSQLGPQTLRNKVLGAIAIGGVPYGGQHTALQQVVMWGHQADMHVVGCGPDVGKAAGGYLGASGATCHVGGASEIFRNRGPLKLGASEETEAIKEDKACFLQCKALGKRVAETAKVIKVGFEEIPMEELCWPKGPVQAGGYDFGQKT